MREDSVEKYLFGAKKKKGSRHHLKFSPTSFHKLTLKDYHGYLKTLKHPWDSLFGLCLLFSLTAIKKEADKLLFWDRVWSANFTCLRSKEMKVIVTEDGMLYFLGKSKAISLRKG